MTTRRDEYLPRGNPVGHLQGLPPNARGLLALNLREAVRADIAEEGEFCSNSDHMDISGCIALIVDDETTNIFAMGHVLTDICRTTGATNAMLALDSIDIIKPDLVLLDIHMPGMDGFGFCQTLKSSPTAQDIPVIFITSDSKTETLERAFSLGAVDYITKPFEPSEVQARVRTHLRLRLTERALRNHNDLLEQRVEERTRGIQDKQQELDQVKRETILRLSRAAELRDSDTGLHIRRIQEFTRFMANKLGMDPEEGDRLSLASAMHDVGKIGIPDSILLKPGKLSRDEFEIMKTHTTIGAAILSGSQYRLLNAAETIALNHHERWDGAGYPQGLSGKSIPLEARIVSIVDCFDAMLARRPYKEPMALDYVIGKMRDDRGAAYDPDLLDTLLENLDGVMAIWNSLQK